jgi:phosphonate transport system substrate-binding protein
MRPGFLGLLGLAAIFAVFSPPGMAGPHVYTIAVVPQMDQRRELDIWRPIVAQLERRTGLKFEIVGTPGIPAFERELLLGRFDFAYMNPYHAYLAMARQGYVPLVRDHGTLLRGIVVVRRDGPIRTVRDLQGRRMAFPAPNACAASLLVRADLKRRFGVSVRPVYVQSHPSVYLNVYAGVVDAGGGIERTLAAAPETVRSALKVIFITQSVAPHPLMAHRRVPPAVRAKVKAALLDLARTPEGRALLDRVSIHQLGPATAADYRGVGALGLEEFYVPAERESPPSPGDAPR